MNYVKAFEKRGFGLFVHFGLYSVLAKGEWAKFSLDIKADIESDDAFILKGENGKYYAVLKSVRMSANLNVQRESVIKSVTLKTNAKIKSAKWIDNGEKLKVEKHTFFASPFNYGSSHGIRVAEITLK